MKIPLHVKGRPQGARKRGGVSGLASATPPEGAPGSNQEDQPPVTHGYVKSFDGTKLFYSIEGKGRPLVFCYGLVCSSLHWTYQVEFFRRNFQTIWFDYRGHQNSEVPKDLKSLTLGNIARDLGVVLDELGVHDPVILGHSMGVNIVLDFYRQYPERVSGMILANGTAQRPLETLFSHNSFHTGFQLLRKLYDKSPRLVSALWKSQKGNPLARTLVSLGGFNPHLTPQADIELYLDQVAEMDPAIMMHLADSYSSYDATPWLHTIKVPTLIIAGEQDKMVPVPQQQLMNQLIPNSVIEVVRHGSHCPQMDLPELVNLKIENFLRSINYGTKPIQTTETASQSIETRLALGQAESV